MNRDRLEGHWKQTKGRARKAAGRWTGSGRLGTGAAPRPLDPTTPDCAAADEPPRRALHEAPAQ